MANLLSRRVAATLMPGATRAGTGSAPEPSQPKTGIAAPLEGASTPEPDEPPGGYGHHDTVWVGYLVHLELEDGASRESRLATDATDPGAKGASQAPCGPVEVYFERGSSALHEQARGQLDRVHQCLEGREKVTIAVIGHDEPRHDKELDEELVAKRTAAVLDYLTDKGVDRAYYDVRAGD